MKFRTLVLVGILVGHSFGLLLLDPVASAASSPSQILISQLQTNGGSGHSGSEFVELYNPTDTDVSIDGWKVQYHSATNSDCVNGWSSTPKIILPTASTIISHGYYLIAATGYLSAADFRFTAGLSDTAGTIRLLRPDLTTSDTLAWGTASCGSGSSASSPTNGRSLERRPGEDAPFGGNSINSLDNLADFSLRTTPEPQSTLSAIEAPVLVENQIAAIVPVYLPLRVTELLIDPVSPATDAKDEFIELQNPNSEPMNIGGYTLKTPSSQFHLLPKVIGPGEYTIVTSGTSTAGLTNDGGNIQVFDPAGSLVDESAPWPKAVPGATWASFSDGWTWTNKPTPAVANIFEELPEANPPSPSNQTSGATSSDPITYLPLKINELYIDPISPQTDDQNEFVELYNPNDEPVDTSGYLLKSGMSLGNNITLDHHIISAHDYLAVFSGETGLPLSNSGSSVGLYDPSGIQIGGIVSYGATKPGQAWIVDADGTWQWSTTSTPGSLNVLTTPIVAVKSSAAVKTPTVKKAKVVAKPVVKKPKKTTASKAKVAKTSNLNSPITAALHKTSGHTLILILLGLTICYVIYEFRYDLRHTYHRFRGHTKPRP